MPFQRPKISKWDFKPIYFAQKCPQNAGNAVSETQISNNFRGGMPLDPLKLCRYYGLPLTKILATPLSFATQALSQTQKNVLRWVCDEA